MWLIKNIFKERNICDGNVLLLFILAWMPRGYGRLLVSSPFPSILLCLSIFLYTPIRSLISSIHFFFGLSLFRLLSTLTPPIFARLSCQYLPTRPNNVDLFFLVFPTMSVIPKHYLLYLFKILSHIIISHVNPTILVFATSILVSLCLFNVQHSDS